MAEELISFETAKLAKEKGFDQIKSDNKWYEDSGNLDFSFQGYDENIENKITAPTQSLLQKWLRDKKNILIYVDPRKHHTFQYHIITDDNEIIGSERLNNWEKTLEKGLYEALKLI